jgi:predicted phosphodiesterase
MTRRRLVAGVALALVSTTLGLTVAVALFLTGSRTIVLAGHDTVVRPTLSPHAVLHTGPLLPDFRLRDVGPVGVELTLGKTEVGSVEELTQRYAFIASEPDAQVAKVQRAVRDMALAALVRGVGIGLLPVVVWLLLGEHRRGQLFRGMGTRRGVLAVALLTVLPLLVWQPWERGEETQEARNRWVPLPEFVGDDVALPAEASRVEVLSGPTTRQTRRLLASAMDTYETSKTFYRSAAADAAELELRERESGETVALLVSDRHDNIGMDRVARAIGERAGASVVLTAGDDTSTGQPWESFSLDSLQGTFRDWDRFGIAGNHDNGPFVRDYLADLDWEMLDGRVVDAPWGGLLLGVDDPRSSGLGNWRDEKGLSFDEVGERLADVACEADERISLLLVHDTNLGDATLERGCADLVVGGHTHVQDGPNLIEADNGAVGYEWTNGTTGGAAYAIAVGSKPRRDAEVSLITFRDGRPVGLQSVRLQTDGSFVVGDWAPIDPYEEPALAAPTPR